MPAFDSWLQRTTNFISPDCQHEMLGMLTNAVLNKIVSAINNESRQFAVIVDGSRIAQDLMWSKNPCVYLYPLIKICNPKRCLLA